MKSRGFVVLAALLPLLAAALAGTGCELVFTASPLRFLARNPLDLSPELQVRYAEDALVSGDMEAMSRAYQAVLDLCATTQDSADYALLAGRLAVELSGVTSVLDLLLRGEIGVFEASALQDIEEAVLSSITDPDLVRQASTYLEIAHLGGAPMMGSSYVAGALAFLLVACEEEGGYELLDQPEAWSGAGLEYIRSAENLLAAAGELYTEDDPASIIVEGFSLFFQQFEEGGGS